jgi:hypothetical protein
LAREGKASSTTIFIRAGPSLWDIPVRRHAATLNATKSKKKIRNRVDEKKSYCEKKEGPPAGGKAGQEEGTMLKGTKGGFPAMTTTGTVRCM